jgi:hypothetical protein
LVAEVCADSPGGVGIPFTAPNSLLWIPHVLSRSLVSVCACLPSPQFAICFSSLSLAPALAPSPPDLAGFLSCLFSDETLNHHLTLAGSSLLPAIPFWANMRHIFERSRPTEKRVSVYAPFAPSFPPPSIIAPPRSRPSIRIPWSFSASSNPADTS